MNILILGANSAIAKAIAREFAAQNAHLYLASRQTDELNRFADDLRIRNSIKVETAFFDAEAFSSHAVFWQQALQSMQTIDGVILAFGYLGQKETVNDYPECVKIMQSNLTGAVSILSYCADYFEKKKQGFIIGIGSVAGDRGRKKNNVYGAAKAGLAAYLQGLRNRLDSHHVHVLTVKPGFVDTPMTQGLPGLFAVASPEYVAKKIVNAWQKKRHVIYVPWFWRIIMFIFKMIPESIFKKLSI